MVETIQFEQPGVKKIVILEGNEGDITKGPSQARFGHMLD